MHSPEPTARASAIRPIGLHEMVLEVADLNASTRFYRDVIGLTIVQRWEGEREAVWFDMGDTTALGLWTRETGGARAIANGRGGAHVHFALRIPHGSVDAMQAHLESVGVPIIERVDFGDGNRSLYVDDPDGNCLELMDAVVDWSNRPIPSRTQEQSG
jgi:catechol 2,3-dioxygenase-like lactoylglutathione lyase family enzyme